MKVIIPAGRTGPAPKFAPGVVHTAAAERLVLSGQVGRAPDGTMEVGLEAQMERTWNNVFAILDAAGFTKQNIVKATVFVTEPGKTEVFRSVRDRMFDGHVCAFTFLQVSGLASPEMLVEIEVEAVKE